MCYNVTIVVECDTFWNIFGINMFIVCDPVTPKCDSIMQTYLNMALCCQCVILK